jgi:shikimate kinase
MLGEIMNKNIYLMGFMGTGKTTVGKALAKTLEKTFIDLDDEIELYEGMTINEIFEKKGESYFREIETKVLKDVASQKNLVVSTGGGSIVTHGNLEIVKKSGVLITLMASPEEILKRVSVNNDRPLLNVDEPLDAIKRLLFERAPFYIKADHIIETTNKSINEVVQEILEILNAEKS